MVTLLNCSASRSSWSSSTAADQAALAISGLTWSLIARSLRRQVHTCGQVEARARRFGRRAPLVSPGEPAGILGPVSVELELSIETIENVTASEISLEVVESWSGGAVRRRSQEGRVEFDDGTGRAGDATANPPAPAAPLARR